MSAEAIRLLLLFGADRTAADAYGRLPVDVLPGGGVGQNGSVGRVRLAGPRVVPGRGSERRRSRPGERKRLARRQLVVGGFVRREPPRPTSTTAGAATTAATTPSATTTTG